MPSQKPLPTLREFVRAAGNAVRGRIDARADTRDGSTYDLFGGIAAMLWTAQVRRDQDLFRATYNDTAQGSDLTSRIAQRYGITRHLDTYGTGTVTVARATAGGGAGTFWEGSRILVAGTLVEPRILVVTADTPVAAGALTATLPIRADRTGALPEIQTSTGLIFGDSVWDTSWTLSNLSCGQGTSFESAAEVMARVREARRAARPGHIDAVKQACRDAGASFVVAYPSNIAGSDDDAGISAVYVADSAYSSSTALVNACKVALERWRVAGADTHVGGVTVSPLAVQLTATLSDNLARIDQIATASTIRKVVVGYFTRADNAGAYKRAGIAGAIQAAVPEVQVVDFALPAADASVVTGTFPGTLTRYSVRLEDVSVTLASSS